jgi:hypothetical protein
VEEPSTASQADMENRRKGRAARVECTFRQSSHLTKVVGVALGDQDAA